MTTLWMPALGLRKGGAAGWAARLGLLGLLCLGQAGCVLAIGATAGAIAGSEIAEDDGEFDPLENTEAMRALRRAF